MTEKHSHTEHPMHQAMRQKAVDKIKVHAHTEGRIRAFLENEVEDFETLFAEASRPEVTKEQLLAEVRQAIEDRKKDLPEIVPFLAHGTITE